MKMIVTTSLRMNQTLVLRARGIAAQLNLNYQDRRKRSVQSILAETEADAVLVVYQGQLVLEEKNGQRFFFHPDTAILRIKSGRDPLLELLGPDKHTVLDCTMGLASDSIVLASAGHQVTALESSQLIHFMVSRGLKEFDSGNDAVNQAMRSIQTIWTDCLTHLQSQADQSVDVIYVDPMFSQEIKESDNLDGLKPFANYTALSEEFLSECRRVARKKLILKAHFRDPAFEKFGFRRHIRPNQKFHYGEIILEENDENFSNRF
ncbi:class I SAM-dependent methyltransferase [Streptococcus suis]|uniref:class I SAM-dependent methyltransferase n=1 Tax=Streptococcus suis TaxID=1307 RepID=UPI002AA2FD5A|nr:class I SAM-dependent methyltransferase [Streptococcus suis]